VTIPVASPEAGALGCPVFGARAVSAVIIFTAHRRNFALQVISCAADDLSSIK